MPCPAESPNRVNFVIRGIFPDFDIISTPCAGSPALGWWMLGRFWEFMEKSPMRVVTGQDINI